MYRETCFSQKMFINKLNIDKKTVHEIETH